MPDQFTNKYNKLAHYVSTAREILQQIGHVDYFVSALGTSGTLMGVGLGLRQNNGGVKIVCAEPHKGHYIQGLKNMQEAIVPSIYDPEQIDMNVMVESEDAFEMARRIVSEEGIFVGMSSGAALYAAREVAKKIDCGTMVIMFADRGEKYLSTDLFKA
jgi:cysteine synthase B